MTRRHWLAAFAALLLAVTVRGPARAKRPAAQACPPARWMVALADGLLVPSGGEGPDVVVLAGDPVATAAIESGCGTVPARVKTTRRGTTITARWKTCASLARVRLSARILPHCQAMKGVVRARKTPAHRFTAVPSTCGDGVLDTGAGENCEEDTCPAGQVCRTCRCTTPHVVPTTTTSTTTAPGGTSTTTSTNPATPTTTTTLPGTPPPDPATVTPPPDPTVTQDFAAASRFLVTSGIQTGVAPGTIADRRAAVLRGRVMSRAGAPIGGVAVTIAGHPELGQTLTRADGLFDLLVNGGGLLVVAYAKAGHLPAQRTVDVPWRESVIVPDVVLIPPDSAVAAIDLPAASMAVLQASVQQDDDGTRRATLLVPAGTTAEMVLPNDAVQPLSTMHVRATEFTVGATGPAAMPGDLPAASGYTYALEYSVDEAVAAGATTVRFNQPVIHYNENFLGFPVGMAVPAGDYDTERGLWVPFDDGRVVKLLGVTAGRAELDVDGSGMAADAAALAALGVSDDERAQLAVLFAPGTTLWRVPARHFSPKDLNYPIVPDGSDPPPNPKPKPDRPDNKPKKDPCKRKGSILGCYDQTLGERVPVAGTPFALHYASDRVPGRTAGSILDIPVSGATVPATLKRIDFEVTIAGRRFVQTFPAQPDQTAHVVWDGIDGYGRRLQGRQIAHGKVSFVYPAVYGSPAAFGATLGGGGRSFGAVAAAGAPALEQNRAMLEGSIVREFTSPIGAPIDARGLGLGGWSLDVHHVWDPLSGRLLLGNGDEAQPPDPLGTVETVAGSQGGGSTGDGGPATQARLLPRAVAVTMDGTFYVTDHWGCRVRVVSPDGVIRAFAGSSSKCGSPTGDEGPALDAGFSTNLMGLAVGPDGSVYVADMTNSVVRRITPDGVIHRVAGTGTPGYSGDGGPATLAQLDSPFGIALGPDGALYIADTQNHRIRRVGPDGTIATIAGDGEADLTGDGGPAAVARISGPRELAVARDGTVYFVTASRIRRVTPDGTIRTIFNANGLDYSGDGGPATTAGGRPEGLAVDLDGTSLLFADGSSRVRRITPDGIVRTVAGNGIGYCVAEPCGDGGPSGAAFIGTVHSLAMSPAGNLYLADQSMSRVRMLTPGREAFAGGSTVLIPAEDGREAYVFDTSGRHLRTVDGRTGSVTLRFGYDGAGRLASLTDHYGNVTAIQRDGAGRPTALVAPGGQRTTLEVNADGFLTSITDPGGNATTCTYGSGAALGLLATVTSPRGGEHAFTYDARGRLLVDADPAGGSQTLARTDTDDGHSVSLTTALGHSTTYAIQFLPNGDTRRTRTDPTGAVTVALYRPDGTRRATYPDGTTVDMTEGPDPRWGIHVPVLTAMTVTTPGGKASTMTASRAATLSDSADPFSVQSETSTLGLNGKTYTSVYDGTTRKTTLTTPSGRKIARTIDADGRTVKLEPDVLAPLAAIAWSFDPAGRLKSLAQDVQAWTWGYDAKNRRSTRTDALGGETSYGYDGADRRAQVTYPGGRVLAVGHDMDGNLAHVTPPGGQAHALGYDAANRLTTYTPPGATSWTATYDADGRLKTTALPGGRSTTRTYDAQDRFATLDDGTSVLTVGYASPDPAKVASVARGPHTLAFGFDGGLATSIDSSAPAAGTFVYAYGGDGSFRPASVAFTSGTDSVATSRTYDADRRLATMGPFTITRGGPAGAATAIGDGALMATFAYDALGRATNRAVAVGASTIHTLDLVFDAAGRVTQRTDTLGGNTHLTDYAYDADGQLLTGTRDGSVVEEYTYDARGNRLTRRLGGGATETATYDAQDRLQTRGAVTYQFDDAGFLTQRGADTFTYDTAGELTSTTVGGNTITYTYDGLRRRITRTDAAGTRRYYYGNPDNTFELTAYRDDAGVLTYCHYDRGRLFALQRGATWYYVATDQIGSPRVVVDSAGVVQKAVSYDAFGVASDTNPGFELPIGFAGGLVDAATGLVRFGLRDYEAASGRWVNRDPILFRGGAVNLYAYVGNAPVYLRDPSGTFSVEGSAYDGIGAGAKLSITSKGLSVCVEAGAGIGSSLEVEPLGDLDGNTFGLKGEVSGKLGPGKVKGAAELNLQTDDFGKGISDCGVELKGDLKACLGPLCTAPADPLKSPSADFRVENANPTDVPNTGIGEGFEGKLVVRGCQAIDF